MENKESLEGLRLEIDQIDSKLIELFGKRMDISERVAKLKAGSGIATEDKAREAEVIKAAMGKAGEKNKNEAAYFMRSLISLSKFRQSKLRGLTGAFEMPEFSPISEGPLNVICQGEYSALAAYGVFEKARLAFAGSAVSAVEALKSGGADFGVIEAYEPIMAYKLAIEHSVFIAGFMETPIKLVLAIPSGGVLEGVSEVCVSSQDFMLLNGILTGFCWKIEIAPSQTAAIAASKAGSGKIAAAIPEGLLEASGLIALPEDLHGGAKAFIRHAAISPKPALMEGHGALLIYFQAENKDRALSAIDNLAVYGIRASQMVQMPQDEGYGCVLALEGALSENAGEALSMAQASLSGIKIIGII